MLERLKKELKSINAEYAGIRDVVPEKRAKFGRKINERKQAVLKQISDIEKAMLDTKVEPIDVTAFTAPNEPMPDVYPECYGSKHPLMMELDRLVQIFQMI